LEPSDTSEVVNMWFLGNMFLDRYLIVNNMEGAGKVGDPTYHPRVGIYDKYAHRPHNIEFMI